MSKKEKNFIVLYSDEGSFGWNVLGIGTKDAIYKKINKMNEGNFADGQEFIIMSSNKQIRTCNGHELMKTLNKKENREEIIKDFNAAFNVYSGDLFNGRRDESTLSHRALKMYYYLCAYGAVLARRKYGVSA
jgi:hypothetical protein